MPAKPWTKAQAKNNKKFQAKLDRITNYLVDGDWHASYTSFTLADGDTITNYIGTKKDLPFSTLEFSRLQGGALKAQRTIKDGDDIYSESYIVGIQPYEKSFYMISLEDNDTAFGDICKQSGVVSLTFLEQSEPNDAGLLGVVQFTNLAGLS